MDLSPRGCFWGLIGFIVVACLALTCCGRLAARWCPRPEPQAPVVLEGSCSLPGPLSLPQAAPQVKGCPEKLICFDVPNAAALAQRESVMKQWIREARARCQPAPPADGGPSKSHD